MNKDIVIVFCVIAIGFALFYSTIQFSERMPHCEIWGEACNSTYSAFVFCDNLTSERERMDKIICENKGEGAEVKS